MELLFVNPVLKETIWGGTRLAEEFGYETDSDHIGESWVISGHRSGDCEVFTTSGISDYDGKTISELWENNRELFGNMSGDVFPLLVKFIDARDDLSIQVHPDDAYAGVNENGSLGKTECWYILDNTGDGKIIVGHNAKTKDELCSMIDNGEWKELIREVPCKKGSFFQIVPGTVHAIKNGTLLIEIQQSCDVTYRLYDYDRLQNGKPRELHLAKAKDVITCPAGPAEANTKLVYSDAEGNEITELVSCEYYTVRKIDCKTTVTLNRAANAYFDLISITDGEGIVNGTPVRKGDNIIVPAPRFGGNIIELEGNMQVMHSMPQ